MRVSEEVELTLSIRYGLGVTLSVINPTENELQIYIL